MKSAAFLPDLDRNFKSFGNVSGAARGQEPPPAPSDSAARTDTVPRPAVTSAEAQAIRDTLQRPPAQHSADWVDVVEFPLKIIGWPLDLVLVRLPAWLVGVVGGVTQVHPAARVNKQIAGVDSAALRMRLINTCSICRRSTSGSCRCGSATG